MGPAQSIMTVAVSLTSTRSHSNARLVATLALACLAVCAVLFIQPSEGNGEEVLLSNPMLMGNQNVQLAQQLQKYDIAIQKVDQGIASSKSQLVAQSHKLGQATKYAVAMHAKLLHDQQTLLTEKARSRAMKAIRSQLAQKESVVMMERRKLQVDSLQLAQLEKRARTLLSPSYSPAQADLQMAAQAMGTPVQPVASPSMLMMQHGDVAGAIASKVSGAGVEPALAHKMQASINEGLKN